MSIVDYLGDPTGSAVGDVDQTAHFGVRLWEAVVAERVKQRSTHRYDDTI